MRRDTHTVVSVARALADSHYHQDHGRDAPCWPGRHVAQAEKVLDYLEEIGFDLVKVKT